MAYLHSLTSHTEKKLTAEQKRAKMVIEQIGHCLFCFTETISLKCVFGLLLLHINCSAAAYKE